MRRFGPRSPPSIYLLKVTSSCAEISLKLITGTWSIFAGTLVNRWMSIFIPFFWPFADNYRYKREEQSKVEFSCLNVKQESRGTTRAIMTLLSLDL